MEGSRGFTSKIGFILSMAAFCIGIGNLWKFPYVVGENGGGAFLIVYLSLVIVIGVPMFIIETTLGRTSQLSPIEGMKKLEGGKKSGWMVIGYLQVLAIFGICTFATTVVGGWSLGYIWKVASGSLVGMTSDQIGNEFSSFSGSWRCVGFSIMNTVLLGLCLISGVKKGVEKVCSILLPTLFITMIGLAVYSNILPGAFAGLKWYLLPDFSKITLSVVGAAAAQVYFSIGIGMCVAYVYGSYIKKDSPLPGALTLTAMLDTLVAFLAGLICTPALFAFSMEPTAGPSLIFVTLPQLFNNMGQFGRIFGVLFMLCVYAAGFSSILGGCEALVASLTDSTKLLRKHAVIIVLSLLFLFSIMVTLSMNPNSAMSKWRFVLGFGLFDFIDFISEGVCMPIGAVLMYIYAIWKWGYPKFMAEVNAGTGEKNLKLTKGLGIYFKIILPVCIVFVCYSILHSFGVF